ncbi:hypothetical protein FC82_GL001327 [Secundilactobacillus collinoides DSM 20515 = JCM 1123]|uniref:Uncharacterized protein n=1 Tax=Secundilactobacillus collinoides DSM 20515 = JCM 1123 TaxID=1423733 RepID=A0A0R2BAH8_SECCO|nr:hypothetical protein FC82_GL001327 [Secundilactobacillus collinoides DSM 20515 = JCM 1123]
MLGFNFSLDSVNPQLKSEKRPLLPAVPHCKRRSLLAALQLAETSDIFPLPDPLK